MIHILDTRHLGRAGIIASTALETDEGLILFDTVLSRPSKIRGGTPQDSFLRRRRPARFPQPHPFRSCRRAAWRFAALGATIYVHPRGARCTLRPRQAHRFRPTPYTATTWKGCGVNCAPISAERVKVLQDDDIVRVAPFEVRATKRLSTPIITISIIGTIMFSAATWRAFGWAAGRRRRLSFHPSWTSNHGGNRSQNPGAQSRETFPAPLRVDEGPVAAHLHRA